MTDSPATPATPAPLPSPAAGQFAPTRWTLVLRARGQTPEARAALSTLCADSYPPVLRFIRASVRNDDTAGDLAQEFFAQLLAGPGIQRVEPGRGRFRSYLLGAVRHFLAEEHRRASAAKRGGGQAPVSLHSPAAGDTTAGLPLPDPSTPAPEALFDRLWAVALVDRAVSVLASEHAAAGKTAQFGALKPWLLADPAAPSREETARQLGLNDGAFKVAVHRLRRRIRELVKAQIAQTVEGPQQIQDELRYLIEVLARNSY